MGIWFTVNGEPKAYGPSWFGGIPKKKLHDLLHGKFVTVGKGIYAVCPDCREIIRLNKFILGDLHFCHEFVDESEGG